MEGVSKMVSVARAGIENLRPAELMAELNERGVLLLDVREPAETAAGTIEGCVLAPRGVLEFYADPTSPEHQDAFVLGRRVIVYSGAGLRSALAARSLQQLGYTDVAHLQGGLTAWTNAGFPLA
jgi:rhodanese-related sulfurtransferase